MPRRKDCTAPGAERGLEERGQRPAPGVGAGRRLGLGPNLASVPPSHQQLGLGWGSRPRPAPSPAGCWAMGGIPDLGAHSRWVDSPGPKWCAEKREGPAQGPPPRGPEEGPCGRGGPGRTVSPRSAWGPAIPRPALWQEGAMRSVLRPAWLTPWPQPLSCWVGRAGWAWAVRPRGQGAGGLPWGWGGGMGAGAQGPLPVQGKGLGCCGPEGASRSGSKKNGNLLPLGVLPGPGLRTSLPPSPRTGGHRSWCPVQREGRGPPASALSPQSVVAVPALRPPGDRAARLCPWI